MRNYLSKTCKILAVMLALVLALTPLAVFGATPPTLLSNRDQIPEIQAAVDWVTLRYNGNDVFQEMRRYPVGRDTSENVPEVDVNPMLPRNLNRITHENNTLYPLAELTKMAAIGFNRVIDFRIDPANAVANLITITVAVEGANLVFRTAPGRRLYLEPAVVGAFGDGQPVGDVLTRLHNGIPHIPMRGFLQAMGVAIHWNPGNHHLTFYFNRTAGPVNLFTRAGVAIGDVENFGILTFPNVTGNVWSNTAGHDLTLTVVPAADSTLIYGGQTFRYARLVNDGAATNLILMAGDRLPGVGTWGARPHIARYGVADGGHLPLISGDAHVIHMPAGAVIYLFWLP